MRYCPTCRTQYTDETLRFCLQDGASLIDRSETDTPTIAFPETPTVEARRETTPVTEWQNDESTRASMAGHSKKKGGLAIAAAAIGLVLLILGIVGAIGIWLLLNPRRENVAANNSSVNNANIPRANRDSPTPTKTATPQTSPTVTTTPSPSADIEPPKQTVAEVVNGWKSMAEELDLDGYMANYADRVDYYNKGGSSRDSVRKDKLRAFTMYDEIRINITNLSSDVSVDGRTATAVFDKEWDFRGRKGSSGKVQTQLRLRNENGRWLITGERDSKVYFTR